MSKTTVVPTKAGDEEMPPVRQRVARKERYNPEGVHTQLFHVKQQLQLLHETISALCRLQAHDMGKWTLEEHADHEADARQCEAFLFPSVNAPKEDDDA